MKHPIIKSFSIAALATAVAACGGSGSDSDSETGSFSLDVTDAPTSQFSSVVIAFTGVSIKPADGEAIVFDFDTTRELDLLTLQGGTSAPLLEGVEVPAGEYEWIRLTLDVDNSFVYEEQNPDAPLSLFIPSGAQTGLKLVSGFTVAQGGENDFTVDFDVRKSIVNPQSDSVADYFLKPALRLVDNLEVGSITGQVDYATINQDDSLVACEYEGSAYIYDGEVAEADLSDLNVNETEGQPLMVVPVSPEDSTSLYSYTAAFLTDGQYTISYACQLDDNETDDTLEFLGTQTVTVEAGTETTAETIPLVQ